MNTAVAVVVATDSGQPIPGVVARLATPGGKLLLIGITNKDGYSRFDDVPVPFTGTLQLAAGAQYYEHDVTVSGNNVTLRVGRSNASPQDILLPGAVPFA